MDNTAATPTQERPSLLPTALIAGALLVVAIVFCSTTTWYTTFKAVHVSFAAIWIGGGFLLTFLALMAEHSRDPHEVAAVAKQAAMVGERLFSPAAAVTLAAGIAMMINTNWGWEHFWIVFGLLGFLSTFVTGIAILSPRAKKVNELVQTVGPTAPETQAAIREILLIARVDIAILLLV